jgi:recombination associated protein RdgC
MYRSDAVVKTLCKVRHFVAGLAASTIPVGLCGFLKKRLFVFKNLMMYRMLSPWTPSVEQLEVALESARFVECGASQEKSVGWVEPRGHAHGPLVEVVGGQWLLKLMIEVKVIPGSVVKRKVQDQIDHIEASTGRKPGKKERREISDDARLALLPMAFTKQGSVQVWISPKTGLLMTDAGSQGKADEVMTWLIKAVEGLTVQLINTQTSPATAMALWLSTKEAPPGFSVDRECELKAADESKAVVRYTRHALDTDEVSQHIAMGKMPTRLALTWGDRVSFVLTEALQLKKVAFLESVFEGETASPGDGKDDNFDADVAIATGELAQLIPDLLEALGGETALA